MPAVSSARKSRSKTSRTGAGRTQRKARPSKEKIPMSIKERFYLRLRSAKPIGGMPEHLRLAAERRYKRVVVDMAKQYAKVGDAFELADLLNEARKMERHRFEYKDFDKHSPEEHRDSVQYVKDLEKVILRAGLTKKVEETIRDFNLPELQRMKALGKRAKADRIARERQDRAKTRQHIKQLRGQGAKGRAKLRKLKAKNPLYKELAK
jgi:hypothetical protein